MTQVATHLDVDVAVIGAGTAGLAAYRAAVAAGARAVIIEGGPYGTTCARVGCMPSKLLIAAAEAAHSVARWPEFGLRLEGQVKVDGKAVMARVRRERDRFVGFVLEGVDHIPERDRLRGYARFIDDHSLQIEGGPSVGFRSAVIATGSTAKVPPPWRALGRRVLINDDIFEWDDLPQSIAVVGPGVIGLELGQALHRLGVKMTMFGRSDHIGPFTDPEVRSYARRAFADEFTLHSDASIRSLLPHGDGVALTHVRADGSEETIVVAYVVATVGRTPNVGGLGLENTALGIGAEGVPVYNRCTMQAGDSNIFIAGDASHDLPLLHEAADEGRIAGDNAARYPQVHSGLRRAPIGIVFSDPQLATVGLPFVALEPGTYVVGEVSFENQGRSRVMLRNKGLMHIYADVRNGRLLGAEMIGPDVEHLAHLLAWALQMNLTIEAILDLPFYHPVIEEGMRTALRDALMKLKHAGTASIRRVA